MAGLLCEPIHRQTQRLKAVGVVRVLGGAQRCSGRCLTAPDRRVWICSGCQFQLYKYFHLGQFQATRLKLLDVELGEKQSVLSSAWELQNPGSSCHLPLALWVLLELLSQNPSHLPNRTVYLDMELYQESCWLPRCPRSLPR